jgi:hypothetical protein
MRPSGPPHHATWTVLRHGGSDPGHLRSASPSFTPRVQAEHGQLTSSGLISQHSKDLQHQQGSLERRSSAGGMVEGDILGTAAAFAHLPMPPDAVLPPALVQAPAFSYSLAAPAARKRSVQFHMGSATEPQAQTAGSAGTDNGTSATPDLPTAAADGVASSTLKAASTATVAAAGGQQSAVLLASRGSLVSRWSKVQEVVVGHDENRPGSNADPAAPGVPGTLESQTAVRVEGGPSAVPSGALQLPPAAHHPAAAVPPLGLRPQSAPGATSPTYPQSHSQPAIPGTATAEITAVSPWPPADSSAAAAAAAAGLAPPPRAVLHSALKTSSAGLPRDGFGPGSLVPEGRPSSALRRSLWAVTPDAGTGIAERSRVWSARSGRLNSGGGDGGSGQTPRGQTSHGQTLDGMDVAGPRPGSATVLSNSHEGQQRVMRRGQSAQNNAMGRVPALRPMSASLSPHLMHHTFTHSADKPNAAPFLSARLSKRPASSAGLHSIQEHAPAGPPRAGSGLTTAAAGDRPSSSSFRSRQPNDNSVVQQQQPRVRPQHQRWRRSGRKTSANAGAKVGGIEPAAGFHSAGLALSSDVALVA